MHFRLKNSEVTGVTVIVFLNYNKSITINHLIKSLPSDINELDLRAKYFAQKKASHKMYEAFSTLYQSQNINTVIRL